MGVLILNVLIILLIVYGTTQALAKPDITPIYGIFLKTLGLDNIYLNICIFLKTLRLNNI